jgi:hypothetical protein
MWSGKERVQCWFPRIVHRFRPVPVGSGDRVTLCRHFSAACSVHHATGSVLDGSSFAARESGLRLDLIGRVSLDMRELEKRVGGHGIRWAHECQSGKQPGSHVTG